MSKVAVSAPLEKVNIRPGVGVLSVISHISYQPWYALGEFVDNAVQSYLTHLDELHRVHGPDFQLKVEIEIDHTAEGRITVRDNAAGIHEHEYARAFRPAALPSDRSGLNEFGMGMKTAACWFARRWTVRTKALGEEVERTVRFNVDDIVRDSIEELSIHSVPTTRTAHYTEIVLSDLQHTLQTKTLSKVREHLASIYRVFLRDGTLQLIVGGTPLKFTEFAVLTAPFHVRPGEVEDPAPRRWHKEINFDFGQGLHVTGFAALREVGSSGQAGLALFRHNRVIQGSGDDTYRPRSIFRASNSFTWQRLSGELHLEGFAVSHTKDGFRWDEQEEPFLELLRAHLDSTELPLLRQAENYRVHARSDDQRVRKVVTATTERAAGVVEREAQPVMERQIQRPPTADPPTYKPAAEPPLAHREVDLELSGQLWRVRLEQTTDPGVGEWLSIDYNQQVRVKSPQGERRMVALRLALAHPFMDQFLGTRTEHLEPVLRLAIALGLAEVAARTGGTQYASVIRTNVNELLREALWK